MQWKRKSKLSNFRTSASPVDSVSFLYFSMLTLVYFSFISPTLLSFLPFSLFWIFSFNFSLSQFWFCFFLSLSWRSFHSFSLSWFSFLSLSHSWVYFLFPESFTCTFLFLGPDSPFSLFFLSLLSLFFYVLNLLLLFFFSLSWIFRFFFSVLSFSCLSLFLFLFFLSLLFPYPRLTFVGLMLNAMPHVLKLPESGRKVFCSFCHWFYPINWHHLNSHLIKLATCPCKISTVSSQ